VAAFSAPGKNAFARRLSAPISRGGMRAAYYRCVMILRWRCRVKTGVVDRWWMNRRPRLRRPPDSGAVMELLCRFYEATQWAPRLWLDHTRPRVVAWRGRPCVGDVAGRIVERAVMCERCRVPRTLTRIGLRRSLPNVDPYRVRALLAIPANRRTCRADRRVVPFRGALRVSIWNVAITTIRCSPGRTDLSEKSRFNNQFEHRRNHSGNDRVTGRLPREVRGMSGVSSESAGERKQCSELKPLLSVRD